MPKLITQERFTVLASAAVAIAILGAAVTAQPSRTTPGDRLERLESDLRYQLELDAKVNPPAYSARTKALDEVLDAWRNSRRSAVDHQLLTAWLRTALTRSLPGDSGDWPPAPEFSAADPQTGNGAQRAVANKPVAEFPTTEAAALALTNERHESRPAKLNSADVKQAAGRSAKPSLPHAAEATANEKAAAAKPLIVHISDPVPFGTEPLVVENPTPPKQPVLGPQESPTEAAPADAAKRQAPTASETAVAYNARPAETEAAKPRATEQPRVEVNLAELNARIGGYHDGLRELEAAVIAGRDGITLSQVAKLVKRLELLAEQYEFVRLYYGSLTPGEREFVMEPRALVGTIELIAQQCSRVETESAEDHFSTAEGSPGTELSLRLQKLSEAIGD